MATVERDSDDTCPEQRPAVGAPKSYDGPSSPIPSMFLSLDNTPGKLFYPILVPDEPVRAMECERIFKQFKVSVNQEVDRGVRLINHYVRTMLLLATESPFRDVRQRFSDFLLWAREELGIVIPKPSAGPSTFFPRETVPSLDNTQAMVGQLMEEIFLIWGRVPHYMVVMGVHPSFLRVFHTAYEFIMRQTGPLPVIWRHFLALMAASRHRCHYLVWLHERLFLEADGPQEWLGGMDAVPKKLANLLQVNAVLAHQPWLMTREHIEGLVRGADSWSIGELVHAFVILSTFHALSDLVWGCGITSEVDFENPLESQPSAPVDVPPKDTSAMRKDTEIVIKLLRQKAQEEKEESGEEREEPDREQLFEKAEDTAAYFNSKFSLSSSSLPSPPTPEISSPVHSDPRNYMGAFPLRHVDFDVHAKEYDIFRVNEYSWSDHGYSLVNRYYRGAAPLLDEEFSLIYNMTDHSFSKCRNINTKPLRQAIWYYVHRLMGMLHDDYDYRNVNLLLNIPIKQFIKKVACHSELVTNADISNLGFEVQPYEKVHITLLVVEARRQAGLLYGLHSIMRYMQT